VEALVNKLLPWRFSATSFFEKEKKVGSGARGSGGFLFFFFALVIS
jgi:hypothetical protein